MSSQFTSLYRFRDVGVVLIRLAFGFQLVKVSYLNALFPTDNLPQFIAFLTALGFPFPTVGAYLAAYTEFLGGILLLLGLWTRWAAIFLTINFSIAFGMAHLAVNDDYQNTFPAVNLLAVSVFLFLNGAGRFSIDALLQQSPGVE
ncbi:DoxX family protein [Spirosoma flavum]|uniref:DoxX family protein n=1 Tax=Spirosoma flavum TaxID=2048557 RepID=A0ABW6AFP3_9BACT